MMGVEIPSRPLLLVGMAAIGLLEAGAERRVSGVRERAVDFWGGGDRVG
jgi:hypothetical protein